MATGLYSQHLHNRKVLYLRNTVITIVLLALAAATLFPIVYMMMSAFGPNVATAGNMRTIFPSRFTLESFEAFFNFNQYSMRWIWNTFVVSAGTVIGSVGDTALGEIGEVCHLHFAMEQGGSSVDPALWLPNN